MWGRGTSDGSPIGTMQDILRAIVYRRRTPRDHPRAISTRSYEVLLQKDSRKVPHLPGNRILPSIRLLLLAKDAIPLPRIPILVSFYHLPKQLALVYKVTNCLVPLTHRWRRQPPVLVHQLHHLLTHLRGPLLRIQCHDPCRDGRPYSRGLHLTHR